MTKSSAVDLWWWPFTAAQTMAGWAETMWNAQAVIGARTPMIAAAFAQPQTANRRELSRMVTEKVGAFGRSARHGAAGHQAIRHAMAANARDLGRMAGGDIFGPMDWLRATERNLALWSSMVALPGTMLEPVRTKAAANARRLQARA